MALPATGYATAVATNPSSSLTDFSLWIDLSLLPVAWWTACTSSDGTKLRAAIDSSGTELAFDVIAFNTGASTGFLRVLWSGSLATSGTQTIRIYPSDSGNTSYAAGDTYGQYAAYDANWKGYWPLNEGSGTAANRKSASHVLNVTGTPWGSDSIGNFLNNYSADTFGSSDALFPTSSPVGYTFIARVKRTNASEAGVIKQTSGGAGRMEFLVGGSNKTRWSNSILDLSSTSVSALGDYLSVGMAQDATTRYILHNGLRDASTAANPPIAVENTATRIHDDRDINLYSMQLHLTLRSEAWTSLEHSQTTDNATFWGTWGWNAMPTGRVFNLLSGKFSGPFQGLVGR